MSPKNTSAIRVVGGAFLFIYLGLVNTNNGQNTNKMTVKKNVIIPIIVISLISTLLGIYFFLKEDKFFDPWDFFGGNRIPLIKPYEVTNYGSTDTWLLIPRHNYGGFHIKNLNVVDSVIVGHDFNPYFHRDTTWYIMAFKQQKEFILHNESDYDSILRNYIDTTPPLYNVMDVHLKHIKDGFLPWFPQKLKKKWHLWRLS